MLKRTVVFGVLFIMLIGIAACASLDDTTREANAETVSHQHEDQYSESDTTESEHQHVHEYDDATDVLVVGDISDEPVKKIERFQPLIDYLAANLHEYGISMGQVKIASNRETMIEWMKNGEVDLFIDSLYPAMVVADASGARPIIRRWKENVSQYHTVFFTTADSGIATLDDLMGEVVAFEDDNSTSGYMLPLAHLVGQGYVPIRKESVDASVSEAEIGYVFSGEDQNTLHWVVSGRAVAGATDSQSYEDVLKESDVDLHIIAETEAVARSIVIAGADVSDELVTEITRLLLSLDETEEGREILAINKTAQFDQFPEGANQAFTRMRELYMVTTVDS